MSRWDEMAALAYREGRGPGELAPRAGLGTKAHDATVLLEQMGTTQARSGTCTDPHCVDGTVTLPDLTFRCPVCRAAREKVV